MKKCFVIQPFDKGKYDNRYNDTYKPAIEKAGYEAYRVDEDNSTSILIESIEKGIQESALCLADISEDNPNVWYELGFAFACNKDVVLVCSDARYNFPFDIRHRAIIKYKTDSISDFQKLGDEITKKITALKSSISRKENHNNIPTQETDELKDTEITILCIIMENTLCVEDFCQYYLIKNEMQRAGFTAITTSIAISTLKDKNYIQDSLSTERANSREEITIFELTELGRKWILANQDKTVIRSQQTSSYFEEEVPF